MKFECNNCKTKLIITTENYKKYNKHELELSCPVCSYGSTYGTFIIEQPPNKVDSVCACGHDGKVLKLIKALNFCPVCNGKLEQD